MGLVQGVSVLRKEPKERVPDGARDDRRLRSREPRELIAGNTSAAMIKAQACLALGAAIFGALGWILPHPPQYDIAGLIVVEIVAAGFGVYGLIRPNAIPSWLPRIGPSIATALTTAAVILSGDSTSGYALFYLWIGLYAFYFPRSRLEAGAHILFAVASYAFAIAVTPNPGPAAAAHADVTFFVITAGTLISSGVLLTYLRGRVERLLGRLVDASRTDPLTGLPNRVALHEILATEIERAAPDRRPLSLLIVDIDGFQALNDRHGIDVGDQILREFGSVLEGSVRVMDRVARSGGEEFAIVLPETGPPNAFVTSEEILDRVRNRFKAPAVEVRASIGVATFPEHGEDLDEVLNAADEALRAAKTLGGDRAVIYSSEVTKTLSAAASRRSVESQAQLATVLSLAEALDQRDPSTARHSQTVGRLCEMMARELGLSNEKVHRVRLAGFLHDIGKIGVPDKILSKAGPLTEEERTQMRRHPELGARILASKEMDDLRSWIVAHHERPDGTGYPLGLEGDEIPLEASILAVADAYEAMTGDRPYRPALGDEKAREELSRNAGTQFDAQVVIALLRALKKQESAARPTARTG
jgi:diguanylate cyclase (GGDEF)-like protein/putative nucleotidyltransferase with HDIG domain